MGMAASQARLLTITARLTDNELRSQTINNAKMRLATQSSQASEKYINALNNARLQFSNYDAAGNPVAQDLTYNALTAYSSYNTQYGLVNSANQILVSEAEADMFKNANGNLNDYLKAHGLEYSTTYFEEIGAIKNANYPKPFDNISVDELKSYYESYGSYENSVEVEAFTKAQQDYVVALNNLIDASEEHFVNYLTSKPTDGYAVTLNSNGSYSVAGVNEYNDISTNIAMLKTVFGGANQFYGLETLTSDAKKFISDETRNEIEAKLNNIGTKQKLVLNSSGDFESVIYLEAKSETGYSIDGNEYTIGGVKFTVDANGYVTALDATGLENSYTDTNTSVVLTYEPSAIPENTKLKDYLEDTTFYVTLIKPLELPRRVEVQYSLDEVEETVINNGVEEVVKRDVAYEHIQTRDKTIAADWLNDVFDECMQTIIANANYENFAYWILDQQRTLQSLLSTDPLYGQTMDTLYGINLNKKAPCGETFKNVLSTYESAKDNFLSCIFATGADDVEAAMRNNETFTIDTGETYYIDADSLMDVDFVLQLMSSKKLDMDETYKTIVKHHLISDLIDVYGEPKYAWLDANDTANTGNADAKAQWYTNLFNRMTQGYKTLENGLASSKEWLEYALESGIVTLEQVDKSFNWKGLDFRTCTKIIEVTDDAAVAAAEAEYNRAMNDIKAKDNMYDLELKNIDTEHTALQTEYDVIKGVIDKNISRTFKFNQSA